MKLSVIVPLYNEASVLKKNCEKIYDFFKKEAGNIELILVNDGSKDNSQKIAFEFAKKKSDVLVLSYSENKGKGYAVKEGVMRSSGDLVLFMDADLATPPDEYKKLLKHAKKHEVVIGSRALSESKIEKKQVWYRVMLGRLGNGLIQLMLLPGIKDTQCGFKLIQGEMARKVFKVMTINRWGFDFELLYVANKFGAKIKEIPVRWRDQEDSKLTISAYAETLFELLRIKWNNLCGKYKK